MDNITLLETEVRALGYRTAQQYATQLVEELSAREKLLPENVTVSEYKEMVHSTIEGLLNASSMQHKFPNVAKPTKTYLLYVRKYNIIANDYTIKVLRVKTDNVYRIVGKLYSTSLERIDRITWNDCIPEREKFWEENNYTIYDYYEPILHEDGYIP